LAIPTKRHDKPLLGYLTRQEMEAVLSAPDANTWSGQRDRVLFAVMYNTGARVSEAIDLRLNDLNTDQAGRSLRIRGKGRKTRVVPLWKQTAQVLSEWLGHESPDTTHQYVEADLKMKEEVLTKAEGVPVEQSRYKPK